MADKSNDLLVGLDIGSSKVVCMIASPVSSSTFKIEGLGECKSEGIEQGGVVDINQAVDCVRAAVEEAEKTANTTVKTVAAGISGRTSVRITAFSRRLWARAKSNRRTLTTF